MTQSQFIQRLKQQPRMGGVFDDVTQLFDAVKAMFPGLITEVTATTEAFAKMSVQFVNAQVSMQKIIPTLGNYLTGLEKSVAFNQKFSQTFIDLNKEALYFEKRNASLNKSLGVTRVQAAKLNESLTVASKTLAISSVNANKYAGSIKKLIPFMDIADQAGGLFYNGMLATQDAIQTNMGLSAEQAENFSYFAMQTGKNAGRALQVTEGISLELEAQYGIQGAQTDIVEGLAKATSTMQLQYGRIPGQLELAVLKSKQLGLSIADLTSTGKNMLDIESSIGKELEYQLLSGRRLTMEGGKSLTNEYRMATLKGDANRQASIMNNLLETEGETLENNMLAREQMASLLGISEDTLSRSLQKKKMLDSLGPEGQALFELPESELLAAAEEMYSQGDITQDELKDIAEFQDTRSTEDILKEQTDIQEDIRLYTFLSSEQGGKLQNLFTSLDEGFGEFQTELFDITKDMDDPAEIAEFGRLLQRAQAAGTITDAKKFMKSAKAEVTGVPVKQDFMIRSSGQVIDFTSQDDIIGAKQGGPIDQFFQGGGGSNINYTTMAKAFVAALQGAKFEVSDNRALDNYYSAG